MEQLPHLLFFLFPPGVPNSDLTVRHVHPASGHLGISGSAGSHHLPRPHQGQQDLPYSHYGPEPLVAGGLEELRGSSGFWVYMS